jgi:hypothetical protein
MSLFSKRLMKWREPTIKTVTPKNILTAGVLIFVVAIPFGFVGGNGRFFVNGTFSIFTYLLGLAFLSSAPIVLLVKYVSPTSAQIQLREDAIVRLMPRINQKSAYEDIQCIYFYRDCSASLVKDVIVIHERSVEESNFTRFQIVMKGKGALSNVFANPVTYFGVPDEVNVEQILQILRDKGVKVIEAPLPS